MNDQQRPLFTVYTATFNREKLLPRAFASINAQTYRDFEWLIVDDGSTDGTAELIKSWQSLVDFPIIYKWQPNGGKHTALNSIMGLLRGELIVSMDSDDEMVPTTLERFKYHWDTLTESEKKKIGCFVCLSKDQDGHISGDPFPKDRQIADLTEMYTVKKITGEKTGFIKREAFTQYPYPADISKVYVPEEVFIQKMAKDWKALCVNDVLRIYWIDHRDDHDGANMMRPKNFPGNRLLHLAYLNYSMRLFWKAPRIFLANAVYYCKLSFHLGIGISKQLHDIRTFGGRLIWLVSLLLGYFLYRKERKNLIPA